jgi:tyrosinase
MAPEKYLITGLKEATGIHPRKDITKFMNPECKQWNLFLAALRAFHDQSEDDQNPLGFYQIAGIHGAPFIHWMEAHEEGDRPMDYCTHRT